MKWLRKLWGLIYDDPRLFGTVILFLILSVIFHSVKQNLLAGIAIWLGLIIALIIAIEYELRKKLAKR